MGRGAVFICAFILWQSVDAAFKDFVVDGEQENIDNVPNTFNAPDELCPAYIDHPDGDSSAELHVSFHDVEQDGVVNTNLLVQALMQHVRKLGLELSHLSEEDLNEYGANWSGDERQQCYEDDELSYEAEKPGWPQVIGF
ncbi:uncharacterized protein LOC115634741 [Scaptodrosophila lebanonensis]|uniref:Uncharacterized protein LOC115634741 n=1 Tax=Drosophila lebanonensis TaxID=7225 RepID=A0A6J2UJT5_DROLE|nr:uncharacterized protein LOC115634741 [Scaptodrosophila lebanonensis]